jgi:glycosyltransferase involved in cell wall biosynthesis
LCYVGRQTESNKAKFLKSSSVILNPGLVGLTILDSFAAGKPIITTDCGLHSPEIDYLINGINGLITSNKMEDYVKAVVQTLTDSTLANRLQKGCITSANHYTLENMVQNFRNGILKALG